MLWKCPCGEVNIEDMKICRSCERSFEKEFLLKKNEKKSFSDDDIKNRQQNKNAYDKDERKNAEEFLFFDCPGCNKKIRIPINVESKHFFCSNCRIEFKIASEINKPYKIILVEKIVYVKVNDERNKRANVSKEVVEAFNFFELPENSSFQIVRRKYIEKMKLYHPDNVSHLAPEFLKIAEEKTKIINKWFSILDNYFQKNQT
jgi:hypothetical protein